MSKKVRSAKGEIVDFDLLKIKEQIATQPPPQDVKTRQDFIERRLRRRIKKVAPPAPPVDGSGVQTDPNMPSPEELSEQPRKIDEPKSTEKPKKTRQRARPPAPHKKEDISEETSE